MFNRRSTCFSLCVRGQAKACPTTHYGTFTTAVMFHSSRGSGFFNPTIAV